MGEIEDCRAYFLKRREFNMRKRRRVAVQPGWMQAQVIALPVYRTAEQEMNLYRQNRKRNALVLKLKR